MGKFDAAQAAFDLVCGRHVNIDDIVLDRRFGRLSSFPGNVAPVALRQFVKEEIHLQDILQVSIASQSGRLALDSCRLVNELRPVA